MPLGDCFRVVWTPFLKKHEGKLQQALGLVCPAVLGCGGDFTLQVGKRKYTARQIDLLRYPYEDPGLGRPPTYLWLIPRPARRVRVRAVWKTPLGRTYRDSMLLDPARPCNVYVIFKTHIDLGYTDRFEGVLRSYRTRLMEKLLENLDSTADRPTGQRFVWMMSTWLLEQCLDRKHVAAGYVDRLEHYIHKGQIVWGLMPFTTHTEFFGLEELCRSLYAARRLAERYRQPVPRAAKMTDVPAHAAALGMAFAAAGGTFFQIGTNPDSRPPAVPPMFWWKLPDGNKLLCHYHGTYDTPLLPPADWPWSQWLSVQVTNDNVGPQGLHVIDHVAWIASHFDWPVCRAARMEDFAEAMVRLHGQALPVIEKEFTDWWIYGLASQAHPTSLARRAKDRLPSAVTLACLASWSSGRAVPEDLRLAVRQAYEKLALYTEHTWGDHATDARRVLPKGNLYTSPVFASGKCKSPIAIDRWVASWADKANHAKEAHQATEGIEARALASFASAQRPNRRAPGIMLFNTLSWPRGGLVHLSDRGLPAGEFELIDAATGAAVLYERRGHGLTLLAPSVPPCGYLFLEARPVRHRATSQRQAEWDNRNLTLHTSEQTFQFHNAGGLARWHDRVRSCQWCSCQADSPFGAYLYEMPSGQRMRDFARAVHTNCGEGTVGFFHRRDYHKMSQFGPVPAGPAGVQARITPLYWQVFVQADCPRRRVPQRRSGDARRYRTVFTQYRGLSELHVRLQLLGKRPTYAAEAGYAFFPISIEKPTVFVDRIAQLVQPGQDLARGVNAAIMVAHRGVRVEGFYAGLNFYPLDTPLVCFGGPGAWRYDENGEYDSGAIYAMLFNNCWGTNFAQWQSGDFTFDFVIQPTGNDQWDGGLAKGGAEFFRPIVATTTDTPPPTPSASLLSVTPASVQLVTLAPAEFGPGTVIRLWNAGADPVRARLTLPTARRRDRLGLCDLLERPVQREIPIGRDGTATVLLRENQIVTLLLRSALSRSE